MLNWRDKFGFPKLAAHLTLLPVIDEFCLLPLPVRKLAFVWFNARRLYEDSAPVAARKHIPVAAVNRVWCTLVISRDLLFVNVCISVGFASGVWMRSCFKLKFKRLVFKWKRFVSKPGAWLAWEGGGGNKQTLGKKVCPRPRNKRFRALGKG